MAAKPTASDLSADQTTSTLDLAAVLKASQALSSEIEFEPLLAKLLLVVAEGARAERCVLLLLQDGELMVTAVHQFDQPIALASVPLESSQNLPIALINTVKHSLEPAMIANAAQQPRLSTDPYILRPQPQSVLCLPILRQAELYAGDFDQNGSTEQIINCADETGQLYPMVLKQELQKQMPSIKKKFVKFEEYAGKKIADVLSEGQLKLATIKQVYTGETVLLLNDGKGNLSAQPLPNEVQFSPVCGAVFTDYDHDGRTDLVMAGNFFDVLPEIGRYDASYGLVLRNTGKTATGTIAYEAINPATSGFFVKGQVRRMALLKQGQLVVAKNNDQAQVFTLKK